MFPSKIKDDSATKSDCHMQDDLTNAAHEAGRKVRSMLHSASDEISHAGNRVTAEIRTNPLQSGLIALGVGVVLGALLRR